MQCDSGIGLAREYDKTSKVDKATIVQGGDEVSEVCREGRGELRV